MALVPQLHRQTHGYQESLHRSLASRSSGHKKIKLKQIPVYLRHHAPLELCVPKRSLEEVTSVDPKGGVASLNFVLCLKNASWLTWSSFFTLLTAVTMRARPPKQRPLAWSLVVQGEEYLFVSSILAWMSFTCNKLNSQAPIIMGKARIREHDIALIFSQNKGGRV